MWELMCSKCGCDSDGERMSCRCVCHNSIDDFPPLDGDENE